MNHQHCFVRSEASQGLVPVAETFSTRRKTASCSTICRADTPVQSLADSIKEIRAADLPASRIVANNVIINQDHIRVHSGGSIALTANRIRNEVTLNEQSTAIKADGGLMCLFAKADSELASTVGTQISTLPASSVTAAIWLTDFTDFKVFGNGCPDEQQHRSIETPECTGLTQRTTSTPRWLFMSTCSSSCKPLRFPSF